MSFFRTIRRHATTAIAACIDLGIKLYRGTPLPQSTKKRLRTILFVAAPALARRVGNAQLRQLGVTKSTTPARPSATGLAIAIPSPICNVPLSVVPPARVIAFYLPQFHPIPENDRFWGKGFTEWTNVKRARPQFEGHYQPRVPGDLGFYDLRQVEVQQRQVELAKLYGIGGFCFYFYWFNGSRVLEAPLEQYLTNPGLDLPFCLCWANENWTRTWDGLTKEVLVEQKHSPEDDIAFIQNLARYLEDPRYIRVNGRPIVIVYRPNLLPDALATAKRWRSWCTEHGIGEIYLAYVQSFETVDPANYGFDAAIEFPPNNMNCPPYTAKLSSKNPNFTGSLFDWNFFVRRSEHYQTPTYTLFRGVNPSWDNEARRPERGTILVGSSPELYCFWLSNALRDTITRFDDRSERLIFVNAWNEWAEGAYLEPDSRFGYAYLQATRNAIEKVALERQTSDELVRAQSGILVVGHDAHPHGAQFLALNILRELRRTMSLEVECLLLRSGSLVPLYTSIAPTHELNGRGPESSEALSLVQSLMRRGFHTALCNTTASGLFVPLLKSAGFRVVSLVHELPQVLSDYEGVGLRAHAGSIAAACDTIVFPGDAVAAGFAKFAPFEQTKAAFLTQGLYKRNKFKTTADIARARAELRERLKLSHDARVILGVGFGDRRKGLDLFVDIGERLFVDMSNAFFVWVGNLDAEIKDELAKRLHGSIYSRQFILPGFTLDTDVFFAGADLYALTSREDAFPSVILESLEVGVPVVSFKGAGAFDEIFRTYRVGSLIESFDTAAFAEHIKRLLHDSGRRTAMGRRGAELVKRDYSFRKYIYDLMTIAHIPAKRVSVIVPNYNYQQYLESRLRSINEQTIPPYEVIVLDDASTDKSREWLEQNLDLVCPGAELSVNSTNSGSVFRQWLSGVRRARGEFVWIAEADDLAQPDFLAEVLAKFDDPEVVLSYCQSKQIGSEGEILCEHYLDYVKDISPTKWTVPYVNSGHNEIVSALAVKNTIPNVSAVVFRRDALLTALEVKLPELTQFRVAGDWVAYIETLRHGKVAYSARSLNLHRRHPSSVTISSFNISQLKEIMSVQKLVRDQFKPNDTVLDQAESYLKMLFEQFGLANSDTSSICR